MIRKNHKKQCKKQQQKAIVFLLLLMIMRWNNPYTMTCSPSDDSRCE